MKRFLANAFMFLLPVLVVLCFLEISLRSIPNNYAYKKIQFLKETGNIQILVLGSSHGFYGVDPDYFSLNGFNFSNVSQSLDLDYEVLKKYGGKINQLQYLVVPISYGSLFGSLSTGIENWRVKNYLIYYGIIPHNYPVSIANFFELLNGTIFSNVGRIYHYHKDRPNNITVSDKGFGLGFRYNIKNNMEETGQEAALRHTKTDMILFEYNKNVIEKIIEWCRNKNIKLVFVTFPAYYTYREKLDMRQLKATVDYMEYVEKYDGVYYYNLLNDDRFVEEFFFDADHLNEIGAIELSKIIDGIIKNIKLE